MFVVDFNVVLNDHNIGLLWENILDIGRYSRGSNHTYIHVVHVVLLYSNVCVMYDYTYM